MKFEYFSITIAENDANPFFSIIMPVYNKAPYIRDTISSILNQTDSSYEVIMIGGASTDDTDIICQEYANTNPDKFRYITQSGKGVSTARNDGILAAKGKYIAFLDADDIWNPEYLETMKRLINDYPDAVFYAGGHTWKFPDGVETSRALQIPRGYIDYFRTTINHKGFGIRTSWIVYDRDVLIDVGLFKKEYIIGEDVDLSIRMALAGSVVYDPRNLGTYMADIPKSLCKSSNGFAVDIPGKDDILKSEHASTLVEYYEWSALNTALQNIVRGFAKIARKQIKENTSRISKKKVMLLTLSYIPTPFISKIHQVYNRLIWRK